MKTPKRDPQEDICPGHMIENPILKAVVNKSKHNTGIFFEHETVVDHCANHCKNINKCTETLKKTIANIFKSYGK